MHIEKLIDAYIELLALFFSMVCCVFVLNFDLSTDALFLSSSASRSIVWIDVGIGHILLVSG